MGYLSCFYSVTRERIALTLDMFEDQISHMIEVFNVLASTHIQDNTKKSIFNFGSNEPVTLDNFFHHYAPRFSTHSSEHEDTVRELWPGIWNAMPNRAKIALGAINYNQYAAELRNAAKSDGNVLVSADMLHFICMFDNTNEDVMYTVNSLPKSILDKYIHGPTRN